MSRLSLRRMVVAIDCPDPRALADFYAGMLGWRVQPNPEDADWVDVVPPAGDGHAVALAFQAVPDFRPPTWPEGAVPQQMHLDFYVDSIEDAEPAVLAAGARRHATQPGSGDGFVVYLDPAGHPFCLCAERG